MSSNQFFKLLVTPQNVNEVTAEVPKAETVNATAKAEEATSAIVYENGPRPSADDCCIELGLPAELYDFKPPENEKVPPTAILR